jgi:phosphoglycerate dehydrogenase-like enzyme
LFTLPNVVVTPHLAGSLGPERRRQGQVMAAELERFAAGEPLRYEVTQATMGRSA